MDIAEKRTKNLTHYTNKNTNIANY